GIRLPQASLRRCDTRRRTVAHLHPEIISTSWRTELCARARFSWPPSITVKTSRSDALTGISRRCLISDGRPEGEVVVNRESHEIPRPPKRRTLDELAPALDPALRDMPEWPGEPAESGPNPVEVERTDPL